MIKNGKVERLDFIVAGAQKCGTTALHYQLEKHPQIALPNKEEMHFFDDEERFARGNRPAGHRRELSGFAR